MRPIARGALYVAIYTVVTLGIWAMAESSRAAVGAPVVLAAKPASQAASQPTDIDEDGTKMNPNRLKHRPRREGEQVQKRVITACDLQKNLPGCPHAPKK